MQDEISIQISAQNLTQLREAVVAEVTKVWHLRGKPLSVTLVVPQRIVGSRHYSGALRNPGIRTLEHWAERQQFPRGFAMKTSDAAHKSALTLTWSKT